MARYEVPPDSPLFPMRTLIEYLDTHKKSKIVKTILVEPIDPPIPKKDDPKNRKYDYRAYIIGSNIMKDAHFMQELWHLDECTWESPQG
jgi:hypothetical protein